MKIVQNTDFNQITPKNSQPMTQLNTDRILPRQKEDFVSLINSLNESIKEYTKVSKSSFMEASTILTSYEKQTQIVINFMQKIMRSNSNNNLSDLFNRISNILEIIPLMKKNNASNNNNLNLFLDDAKLLFKEMRQAKHKENEKLKQINQYEQCSTESNGYNSSTQQYSGSNNSHRINPINEKKNFNMIYNIYTKIMKLLNNFAEYNYIISKVDLNGSNKFNLLQNSVKKELENLMILLKKYFGNNFEFMEQNKSCINLKARSKSINNNNKDIEKLKNIIEQNKRKIMELNMQLNNCKNKIMELNNENNNLNIKLMNAEQLIQEKDMMIMNLQNNENNNMINNSDFSNLNNTLNQKDIIISNLKKQINVYQKKEKALDIQINNINSQFTEKIGQYEYKISSLTETIKKQKIFISNLQKENQSKSNEIENLKQQNFYNNNNMPLSNNNNYQQIIQKLQNDINNKDMMIMQYENKIYEIGQNNNINNKGDDYGMNKKIEILNLELKEKQSKINALNEELINYQRKEKNDRKQIEDMNMQILTKENVIKQKDELINNNSNNDIFKIKLENEKLKKQLEELLSKNNNYFMQNQRMINGNINSYEAPDARNQELIKKINELTQENQTLKESIKNLESEIAKKKDELEGLQTFILKLQSQIEQNNEMIQEKNRVNIINNNQTKPNQKELIKANKNLNKSFELTTDTNTKMMNKYLTQLNDAEKTISILQNQNKELKYKLEEKQVEKEFSGYRTEDFNMSNYEEEFDLKKMVNGARDKNRSEDINIDYPGVQSIKDKYKELVQSMNLLEEQVKILICNININNKVKPQVSQICQLMKIHPKNIQNILAGKDKKKMLGIM